MEFLRTAFGLSIVQWKSLVAGAASGQIRNGPLGPGGLELFATHERDIIQVLRLLPYGTRRARDATIQHLEDLGC